MFLIILGPSGPFWTILDKNDFFAPNGQSSGWQRCFGAKNINSCLKRSKRVQMGPKGSLMVKNTYVDHFGPFRTLLDHFGTLTSLPCLASFGPKWTIFGASPVMNGGPQSKKNAHHQVTMCGLLVEPQKLIFLTNQYNGA